MNQSTELSAVYILTFFNKSLGAVFLFYSVIQERLVTFQNKFVKGMSNLFK